jgi:hypothetical protein
MSGLMFSSSVVMHIMPVPLSGKFLEPQAVTEPPCLVETTNQHHFSTGLDACLDNAGNASVRAVADKPIGLARTKDVFS